MLKAMCHNSKFDDYRPFHESSSTVRKLIEYVSSQDERQGIDLTAISSRTLHNSTTFLKLSLFFISQQPVGAREKHERRVRSPGNAWLMFGSVPAEDFRAFFLKIFLLTLLLTKRVHTDEIAKIWPFINGFELFCRYYYIPQIDLKIQIGCNHHLVQPDRYTFRSMRFPPKKPNVPTLMLDLFLSFL